MYFRRCGLYNAQLILFTGRVFKLDIKDQLKPAKLNCGKV